MIKKYCNLNYYGPLNQDSALRVLGFDISRPCLAPSAEVRPHCSYSLSKRWNLQDKNSKGRRFNIVR